MEVPLRARIKEPSISKVLVCVLCALFAGLTPLLSACGTSIDHGASDAEDENRYLSIVDAEPESVDPQCILENYTAPLNIFDRLVEVEQREGGSELTPSLAESWECSGDGCVYTFTLKNGVTFSNGAALTASDVKFSFERLLTNPLSCHADLMEDVLGADNLLNGDAAELEGFRIVDDNHFTIELSRPSAAFIWKLTTPAASILDEETTLHAGESFGHEVFETVGTGPFVLSKWSKGKSIVMRANSNYWAGLPACSGIKMLFHAETSSLRDLYTAGSIDILDLGLLDMDSEYFLRGDSYFGNLVRGKDVGITFVALNNSLAPLNDVRVRHALALGLDRSTLLTAAASGRGMIENGIFPYGLSGHNDELPQIPYDPAQAKNLLAEAGFAGGFDLVITCPTTTSQSVRDLVTLIAALWSNIGVRTHVENVNAATFNARREAGELACYVSTFTADYNDPQCFIEAFFEGPEVTDGCSICYQDTATMRDALNARTILDDKERIRTYQEIEQKIVQEDYAWIPLYSKARIFVVGSRVDGFEVRWNGWPSNRYDKVRILEAKA